MRAGLPLTVGYSECKQAWGTLGFRVVSTVVPYRFTPEFALQDYPPGLPGWFTIGAVNLMVLLCGLYGVTTSLVMDKLFFAFFFTGRPSPTSTLYFPLHSPLGASTQPQHVMDT